MIRGLHSGHNKPRKGVLHGLLGGVEVESIPVSLCDGFPGLAVLSVGEAQRQNGPQKGLLGGLVGDLVSRLIVGIIRAIMWLVRKNLLTKQDPPSKS